MSTPDFLPQDDTNYSTVRFYTALDPYFFTIDNRPLQDLEANIKAARSGGGDAARRAAALLGLNLSMVSAELIGNNKTTALTGLQVLKTGNNSVRVSPGAYYDTRAVTTSISDLVVKQALLSHNADFNIPSPVTAGTSIIYTIEGEFSELSTINMATSSLPYVDATNDYLPSTLIHGELRLTLNSGVAAVSPTVPTTTVGKFPIYNIRIAQGATTYTIELHANAPSFKTLSMNIGMTPLATGGITRTVTNEMNYNTFVEGSTTGGFSTIILNDNNINAFTTVKIKMSYVGTVTGGNAAFRIRYKAFSSGELASVVGTSTTIEAVPVTAAAGGIQSYTLVGRIPSTEFSGFVSNKWALNKEILNIVIERVGANGLDTNTGDIQVLSFNLIQ